MGYIVESYDFTELSRVSVEGKIAPSLFWALPVGKWRERDLNYIWDTFKHNHGPCHDYGYLLVKQEANPSMENQNGRNRAGGPVTNLSFASASLQEVLPDSLRNMPARHRPWDREQGHAVMILAGSYPQPGWGVLLQVHGGLDGFLKELEMQISGAVRDIEQKTGIDAREAFIRSGHAFREIHDARKNFHSVRTWTFDLESHQNQIETATRCALVLEESARSENDEQIIQAAKAFHDTLKSLLSMEPAEVARLRAEEANDAPSLLKTMKETLDRIGWMKRISLADPRDLAIVEPLARRVVENLETKDAAMNSMQGSQRGLLNACILAMESGLINASGPVTVPLETVHANMAESFKSLARRAMGTVRILAGSNQIKIQENMLELEQARRLSEQTISKYHSICGETIEIQEKVGPHLLICLEKRFRDAGHVVTPVPWDPARMVGWKVFSGRGNRIRLSSLRHAASRVHVQPPDPNYQGSLFPVDENPLVDGSFFTDYVHHVAISSGKKTPWQVASDLIGRLFIQQDLEEMIGEHFGSVPANLDKPEELLLEAMGWKKVEKPQMDPLMGLILFEGDAPAGIQLGKSINDLRIALESYCKDLLDVIVSRLQYDQETLVHAIDDVLGTYRWSDPQKRWNIEVAKLSVGGACILIRYLGNLAFARQQQEIEQILEHLNWLGDNANIFSHDNQDEFQESRKTIPRPQDFAKRVASMLSSSARLIGDLPWHMEVTSATGNSPVVLSGEAWSHGSTTPRLLKVLCWEDLPPGRKEIVFWNPRRQNPVVPDPKILRRPGS